MDRQRGVLGGSARGGSTDGLSRRIRSVLALAAGNQNLYVAVGREVKVYKQVLAWALKNNPAADRLVLLHVHCPSPLIPVGDRVDLGVLLDETSAGGGFLSLDKERDPLELQLCLAE